MRPALDYWLKVQALLTAVAAAFELAVGEARRSAIGLKWAQSNGPTINDDTLNWLPIINQYDIVSIDVFDTLISRRLIDPELLHVVVACEVFHDARAARWPSVRMLAEHRARQASIRPDVSLAEIYDCVRIISPDWDVARLRATELSTEMRLACATRRGLALWKAVHKAGKVIVVATDIYLPRQFVEDLLHRCGYDGWAALYVSGDDGIAKYNGTTYAHVANDFTGRRVLHIGDNVRSDVEAAKRAGIDAIHLRRPLESSGVKTTRVGKYVNRHLRRKPDATTALQLSILGSLAESWLDRGTRQRSQLEQIGYRILGPALVGFSQYLEGQVESQSLSKLVFLAREGALLKRAFDSYTTLIDVETDYAILSTRVLGIVRMSSFLTDADIQFLTKTPVAIEARSYITRVLPNINFQYLDRLLLQAGVQPAQRLSSAQAAADLQRVFQQLLPELAQLAATRRDAVVSYLESLGIRDPATSIVDVGWQGTINFAVSDLLRSQVSGLYWGLRKTTLTSEASSVSAWVDQRKGGTDARLFSPLFRFAPAFEILLANTAAGSAAGVALQSPRTQTGSGYEFSYLPVEFDQSDKRAIQLLQDSAIQFVEDFGALRGTFDSQTLSLGRGVAHHALVRLLTRPSVEQFGALRSISFDGTYGVAPQALGNWWVPPEVRRNR